ncbi:HAD family hydrolase [Streptacidiphilus monticola]|uniref:HAD family hydrolase n=1 Tax=Streptacidiphilus monticola TaxID=2161674 RepID=A0ABW1FX15_9ACTN
MAEPIRAVVWDIDDTIFDYSGAERAGILGHLEELGLLGEFDSPDHALALWCQDMESAYARFLAGELDLWEQRRVRVRAFLGRLGLQTDDPAAWFRGYLDHYERSWRVFPDVLPALAGLTGYRHGLLSNSSLLVQRHKTAKLGLAEHFSFLLCSEELGVAKPAPEAFLAACTALDLPPRQVAYVGDKLETDALGASAAGLRGIWLDRSGAGTSAQVERITTLAELPELLRVTDFGAVPTIG